MITYNFRKYIKALSGLCLTVLVLLSCTNDYFVDENNFRLYVPQIQDGSIHNFYVAFHNESGSHVLTREITAPFDKDDMMKQGILRFKLPPGKNYHISCFADYTPGSISIGDIYDESRKAKELDLSERNDNTGDNNVYCSRTSTPRSVFTTATVYPIGHPNAKMPFEVNIDETRLFKGNVILSFIDLPAELNVSRIDTYYSGLSTAYHFDGTFRTYTTADRIRGSYSASDNLEGSTVNVTDIINPSAGTEFGLLGGSTRGAIRPVNPMPLELTTHLYDAEGNNVGTLFFTKEDFDRLADDKKPVDKEGTPASSLVLRPQETLKFTFKGFTVISIELVGWGDINHGTTTPM